VFLFFSKTVNNKRENKIMQQQRESDSDLEDDMADITISRNIDIPRVRTNRGAHRRQQSAAVPLPKPEPIFDFDFPSPSSSLPTPNFPLPQQIKRRTTASPRVTPEAPKKHHRRASNSRFSAQRSQSTPQPILDQLRYIPFSNGKIIPDLHNENFTDVQIIGSGSQGNVVKAFHIVEKKWYAIKILKSRVSGFSQRQRIQQQIADVQRLSPHPHLVSYTSYWEYDEEVFLQMPLYTETLGDFTTRWQNNHSTDSYIEESILWEFLTDVTLGLHQLQKYRLMHRDIKPGNLFIADDNSIMIGDFGLLLGEKDSDGREGDCRYLAQEVLRDDMCTHKADIFSLGATMLELSCLIDLPQNDIHWDNIRNGDITQYFPSVYSDAYKLLISQMMTLKRIERPTAVDILEHPIISSILQKRYKSRGAEYTSQTQIIKRLSNRKRTRSQSSPAVQSTRVLRSSRKALFRK